MFLCIHAGLRLPVDQRQITPGLPLHLVDVLSVGDGVQNFSEASGSYQSFILSFSKCN